MRMGRTILGALSARLWPRLRWSRLCHAYFTMWWSRTARERGLLDEVEWLIEIPLEAASDLGPFAST